MVKGQRNFNCIALLRSSLHHPSIYVTANMNTYFVESILLVKIWKHFLIMFLQNGIHFLQKALWLHISENATNAMLLRSCAVNVNILNKTIFASSSENRKKTNSDKKDEKEKFFTFVHIKIYLHPKLNHIILIKFKSLYYCESR